MRFFEVLAQVVGLLVLEQRLSYQALKRLFELDDAYIEDLKVEIIEVRQLARDHEGRMLVWTGEGLAPRAASQRVAHDHQPPRCPNPQSSPLRSMPNGGNSRCCSVTWWVPRSSPVSLILKTCVRWCVPTSRPRLRSLHATRGILPNTLAMGCWSTLATPPPMKTMPGAPCTLAWALS